MNPVETLCKEVTASFDLTPIGDLMNRELLRAWATYYYRTEVFDRRLPHRIVHGTARVWPPSKGLSDQHARQVMRELELGGRCPERDHCADISHERVCALVDELGEVPRPQPQRFVGSLRAFVA